MTIISHILKWLYATLITITVVIICELICVLIGMGSDFMVGFIAGVSFVISYIIILNRKKVQITREGGIISKI